MMRWLVHVQQISVNVVLEDKPRRIEPAKGLTSLVVDISDNGTR
jgi:hypothetical protein